MASTYKVGTIGKIFAKELGGSDKQKTDPKLAALFGNAGVSSSPTAKVFRTVKVSENNIFKKKVAPVSSDIAAGGVTAKKVAKKKKDTQKSIDDVILKHKDAAEIRVSAKKKVKVELKEESGNKISVKLKKKNKKNKKLKGVQNKTTTTSTSVATPDPEGPASVPTDGSKKKEKKKKRQLDADNNTEEKAAKKVKLDDDDGTLKKRKQKKKKGTKVGSNQVKNEEEVIVKEENESADDETDQKSIIQPVEDASLKTLAEKNAPKAKDPELEARTLFVGNLPGDIEKKMLKKLFKKYGKIETVRLRGGAPNKPTQLKKVAINKKELHSDKNTLAGYIRFATREEAENAANKGRGLVIKENHIVLDLADQGQKRDNKKAIFIGNLNLKITDEELWRFFEDCGTISSVRVIRDNATGLGKGFGYVNFDERDAVEKALQKNQQELRNRGVRISRCVKKLKVKKAIAKKVGGGKPGMDYMNRRAGKSTGDKMKFTENDAKTYSGDRLAEIGKLKRKSNKPNRGELHKAKIIRLLTQTGKPSSPLVARAASSKPTINKRQGMTNRKRYFN